MENNALKKNSEADQIRANLWTKLDSDHTYQENQALFLSHLLDQYKIYVEMADRISARRNLANGFFLTLHSSILTAISFLFDKNPEGFTMWVFIFLFMISFFLCLVWWWLIRSYKNLNSAKYKVIGFLEEKLPASPYYKAEWIALGEGKSLKKYLPLTIIEQWIPVLFLIIYLVMILFFGVV